MIEIDLEWTQLQLVETRDAAGVLHVALVGELDLAVADRLCSRLQYLTRNGNHVRVDLSQLEFIDVSGVRALIRAAQHRRQPGERLLEIDHQTTPIVRRMIDIVGAAPILWPTNHSFE